MTQYANGGTESENEQLRMQISQRGGAPLFVVTYHDNNNLHFSRRASNGNTAEEMAKAIKNQLGFQDVTIYGLQRPEKGQPYYAVAADEMKRAFPFKTARSTESGALPKSVITQRGLELEELKSVAHAVKVSKKYDADAYFGLADTFRTVWRNIGGEESLADIIDQWLLDEYPEEDEEAEEAEEEEVEV